MLLKNEPVPLFAANFLRNGTFELGSNSFEVDMDLPETSPVAYYWTMGTNHTRSSDRAHSGSWSLKSTSTVPTATTSAIIYVETNTQYKVSGWIYNSLASGNAYIDLADATGEPTLSSTLGKNAWEYLEGTWNSGNYTTVQVRCVTDGSLSGQVWFDDILFERIPCWVKTSGYDFYYNGRKWYTYGSNYWPRNCVSTMYGPWMDDSGHYDIPEIEKDLRAMERCGMNMVYISFTHGEGNPVNLVDFVQRCDKHCIKVNLAVRDLNPMSFNIDPNAILNLIQQYNLQNNDNIYAYDIAWEPSFGSADTFAYPGLGPRNKWDTEWYEWIVKRYGSVAQAESILGALNTTSNNPFSAGVVLHNIPSRMVSGQTYTITIVMKNNGQDSWTQVNGFRLRRLNHMPGNGYVVKIGPEEINLNAGEVVLPGNTRTFSFQVAAPSPGRYLLAYKMHESGIGYKNFDGWFGGTCYKWFDVVDTGTAVQETITYEKVITSPTDAEVQASGASAKVAAYRHFVDELISRNYGFIIRQLKAVAPNQLASFRQSSYGRDQFAMTYDFKAVSMWAEFLQPEAYTAYNGDTETWRRTGFDTLYARYAGGNLRPVFWAEGGYSLFSYAGNPPPPAAFTYQQGQYKKWWIALKEAYANGVSPWWWPGGWRAKDRPPDYEENSDFGIVSETCVLRKVMTNFIVDSPVFTQSVRDYTNPNSAITIDRDLYANGYLGVYNARAANYTAARTAGDTPYVRTPGTGTNSKNTPLTRIGNTGSGPVKYLKSEFVYVKIKDAYNQWINIHDGEIIDVPYNGPVYVTAKVANTGEAEWYTYNSPPAGDNGTVKFAGNENLGNISFRREIPYNVPYLSQVEFPPFVFTNGITAENTVVFQMVAEGRAWFGDLIKVRLRPVATAAGGNIFSNSVLQVKSAAVPANGSDRCTVVVTVKSETGVAKSGVAVTLFSTGHSSYDNITQPAATDANGMCTGYVSSYYAGTSTLYATATGETTIFENFLSNPSFEAGFTDWQQNSSVIDSTTRYSGLNSARLVSTTAIVTGCISNTITITNNAVSKYRVSFYARTIVNTPAYCVTVFYYKENNDRCSPAYEDICEIGATDFWRMRSITVGGSGSGAFFTFPSDCAKIRIGNRWFSSVALPDGTAWLDGVRIERLPTVAWTATRCAFASSPFTTTQGNPSPQIKVEARGNSGTIVDYSFAGTGILSTSSPGGSFSTSNTTWVNTTTAIFGSGVSYFYYKDSNVGSPWLTISRSGFISATQQETILGPTTYETYSYLRSKPLLLKANGTDTVQVVVNLRDTYSYPIPNSWVTILTNRGSNTDVISPSASQLTDTGGSCTFTISSQFAGTTTIQAKSQDGKTISSLFFDNFSTYEEGSSGSPVWSGGTVEGGEYSLSSGAIAIPFGYEGSTWGDYIFECRMKTITAGSASWDDGRLYFRYTSAAHTYYVLLHTGSWDLEMGCEYNGSHYPWIASASGVADPYNWNTFRIEVSDSEPVRIKVYVNGILRINYVTNSDTLRIPNGRIALCAGGNSHVHFDDVRIWPVVARFNPTRLVITTGSFSIPRNTVSGTITVEARGAGDKKDPSDNFRVYLSSSSSGGEFSLSPVTWQSTNTIYLNQGSANFFYRDSNSGNPTITVSRPGLAPATLSVWITDISPEISYCTVSLPTPLADNVNRCSVTVQVINSLGQVQPNKYVSIYTSRGSMDTVVMTVNPTNALGIAQGYVVSPYAGGAYIYAVCEGVTINENIVRNRSFEETRTLASNLRYWTQGTNHVRSNTKFHTGGWSLLSTYSGAFTATVADTFPVAPNSTYGFSGWIYSMLDSGSCYFDLGLGSGDRLEIFSRNVWANTSTLWYSGNYTTRTFRCVTENTAGSANKTVWFDDVRMWRIPTVTFMPYRLVFVSPPFTITANNPSPAIIIQAQDAAGLPAQGYNETITMSTSGGGTFSSDKFNWSAQTVFTLVDGQAIVYYKQAGTGNPTITASRAGLSPAVQTVSIVDPSTNDSYSFIYTPVPVAPPTLGANSITVFVTIKDTYGYPISGRSVLLTTARAATGITRISANPQTTNASGKCSWTISSGTSGRDTVSAICDGRIIKNIFFDSFSVYSEGADGSPEWTIHDGIWQVSGQEYLGTNSGDDSWCALGASAGNINQRDYTVVLRFKMLSLGDDWRESIRVGFRFQNYSNEYTLDFYKNGYIYIEKKSEGITTNDSTKFASFGPTGAWYYDGNWHDVTITVAGRRILVRVDDTQCFDVTDNDFNSVPALLYGKIMLSAHHYKSGTGNTIARFDDVRIYPCLVDFTTNTATKIVANPTCLTYCQFNPARITLQAQDDTGFIVSSFNNTVSLSTSSPTGKFSVSRLDWVDTSIVTLVQGQIVVYYRDTALETAILTFSRQGLKSDTATIYITAVNTAPPIEITTPFTEHFVYCTMGSPNSCHGLVQKEITPSDGTTIYGTYLGLPYRKPTNTMGEGDEISRYIYFDIQDDYIYNNTGQWGDVLISVKYLDTGTNSIYLEYDAQTGAFQQAPKVIQTMNSGQWKRDFWVISGPRFANRQFGMTDFRLYCPAGNMYINSVEVHRAPGNNIGPARDTTGESTLGLSHKLLITSNFYDNWNFDTWSPSDESNRTGFGIHPAGLHPSDPAKVDHNVYASGARRKSLAKRLIKDALRAGFNVLVPGYCGRSSDAYYLAWLKSFIEAMDELENEGYWPTNDRPKIAQFIETNYTAENILCENTKVYGTTDDGKARLYREIRDFWSIIPSRYWCVLDLGTGAGAQPLIFTGPNSDVLSSDQSTWNYIGQKFREEFNRKPYVCNDWATGVSNNTITIELWSWGNGQINPPDLTKSTPGVGAHFNNTYSQATGSIRDPMLGEWYRIGLDPGLISYGMWDAVLYNVISGGKNKIVVATYNQMREGSGIQDSVEFGRREIRDTLFYKKMWDANTWRFSDTTTFPAGSLLRELSFAESPPVRVKPGQQFKLKVRVRNTGQTGWCHYTYLNNQRGVVRLAGWTGNDTYFAPLPDSMAPGDSAIITLNLMAPSTEGTYTYEIDLYNKEQGTFRNLNAGNSPLQTVIGVYNSFVPPGQVSFTTVETTSNSIKLNWTRASQGTNPVEGYYIYYRTDNESIAYEFVENFSSYAEESNCYPTWRPIAGSWKVKKTYAGLYDYNWINPGDGILEGLNAGDDKSSPSGIWTGDQWWDNYNLYVSFKIVHCGEEGDNGIRIGFRYLSDSSCYTLNINPRSSANNFQLLRITGSTTTVLATYSESLTTGGVTLWQPNYASTSYIYKCWEYDKWHNLKITANGSQITVWFDGNQIIDYNDAGTPVTRGRISLSARKYTLGKYDTHILFDNIKVEPLVRPEWWLLGTTTDTSFLHSGLSPGTSYSYKVVAFDNTGETGTFSSIWSTTMPANPTSETLSYLRTNGSTFIADGITQCKVTVTVKGINGLPVYGKPVTVFTSRGTSYDSITQPSEPTDINGQCTAIITSFYLGADTIYASCQGVTITQNLLNNPSFEESGAWYLAPDHLYDTPSTDAKTGQGCLKFSKMNASSQITYQVVPVEPLSCYEQSAWIKRNLLAAGYRADMDWVEYTAEDTQLVDGPDTGPPSSPSNVWTRCAQSFYTNTNTAKVRFRFLNTPDGLSGSAWFDDARLKRVPTINWIQPKIKILSPVYTITKNNPGIPMTVEVQDLYGNRDLSFNTTVELVTTSGLGSFSISSTTWVDTYLIVLKQGFGTFYYKDGFAGTPSITVQRLGYTPDGQVITIVEPAVDPVHSYLKTNTFTYPANGVAQCVVSIYIRDQYDYPISGKSVVLYTNRGAVDNITQPGATDANGMCTGYITSTLYGGPTIYAISDGVTVTQNLFYNCSFEQQGDTGMSTAAYWWMVPAYSTHTTNPHSRSYEKAHTGNWSGRSWFDKNQYPDPPYESFDHFWFTIDAYRKWKFSAWMYNGYTSGEMYLDLSDIANDPQLESTQKNVWEYKEKIWTGDSNTQLKVRCISQNTTGGPSYFDDIRFQRIPTITFTANQPVLDITSDPFTSPRGSSSPPITIEAQNTALIRNEGFNGTATLSTNSPGGKFSISNTNWVDITIITFNAGLATVYYKDTQIGNPIISVYRSGYYSDTQQEQIIMSTCKGYNSSLDVSNNTFAFRANGTDRCTVCVTVRDLNYSPIWGAQVTIFTNRGSLDIITQPPLTNMNGQCTGSFVSNQAGGCTIMALCDGETIYQNLVKNPSFEEQGGSSNDATYWTEAGNHNRDSTRAHSGSWSLRCITGGPSSSDMGAWHTIPVYPYSNYIYSAWFWTQHTAGNLYTDCADVTNDPTIYATQNFPQWEYKTIVWNSTDVSTLHFRVVTDGGFSGTSWCDDISFRRYPTVSFIFDTPAIRIITPPKTITPNNPTTAITVEVQNVYGDRDTSFNDTVTLRSDATGFFSTNMSTWYNTTSIYLSGGYKDFYYKNSTVGAHVITASRPGYLSDTQTVQVVSPSVNSIASYIMIGQTSVPASGSDSFTVVVTICDTYGYIIPNKSVTLVTTRGNSNTISANPQTTDAQGRCTFTVSSTFPGDDTLSAVCDGNTITYGFLSDKLNACWLFNEGGGWVFDVTGRGNTGTIYGATRTTGPYGPCLSFDGVDDYVEVPASPSINISDKITVEAWIKCISLTNWGRLIAKSPYPNFDYFILLGDSTFIGFRFKIGGIENGVYSGVGTFQAGEWYHIVGTYDSTVNFSKLFINTANAGTSNPSGLIDVHDTMPLNFGRDPIGSAGPPCMLDDIRIYNRALNDTEVRKNYSRRAVMTFTPAASRLKITSSSYIVTKGNPGPLITVQALDNFGNVDPNFNNTITLYTSSNTGFFSVQKSPWLNTTTLLLINGTGSFYYKDNATGNPVISVYRSGLVPDSQIETIVNPTLYESYCYIKYNTGTVPANGTSIATITVFVADTYAYGISGKSVSLYTVRGANTTTISAPNPKTTDANGMATWTISSSTAGREEVRATNLTDSKSISVLFYDDFETGTGYNIGWTVYQGEWERTGGYLKGRNSGNNGHVAYGYGGGDPNWVDYEVTLKFRILSFGGDWRDSARLGFRWIDQNNAYTLDMISFDQIWINKISQGTGSADPGGPNPPLAQISTSIHKDGNWHDLRVRVQVNHIIVWLDNNVIFDVFDNNYLGVPFVPRGKIMLSAHDYTGDGLHNTEVHFDDVKVYPAWVDFVENATKLKFTTGPFTIVRSIPSPRFTVEAQGPDGFIDPDVNGVQITLSSSNSNGRFSVSSQNWVDTNVLTMYGGSITFYYRDPDIGTPTLTVSGGGFSIDTQVETIIDTPVGAVLSYLKVNDNALIPADGITPCTVTVYIYDTYSNPLQGRKVSVYTSRGSPVDTITYPYGNITDANGVVYARVVSMTSGQDTITALCDGNTIYQNILPNFSFEQGSGSDAYNWTEGFNHFRSSTRHRPSGLWSLESNFSGSATSSVSYSFSITPNSYYKISAWIYNSLTQGEAYIDLNDPENEDPAVSDIKLLSTNGSNAWEYLEAVWYSGMSISTRQVRCVTELDPAGNVWFDDISFRRIPTVTFTAQATQLVITSSPFTMTKGNPSPAITVEAQDNLGLKDTSFNSTITLLTTSNSASFSLNRFTWFNTTVITMQNGSITFYYKDNNAGNPIITVFRAGLSADTQSETIVAPTTFETNSYIWARPFYCKATGTESVVVIVTVIDTYGFPISGKSATLTVSRTNSDALSPSGAQITDANGQATWTISSQYAGQDSVAARAEGKTIPWFGDNFFLYPEGSDGSPNWTPSSGTWYVNSNKEYVETDTTTLAFSSAGNYMWQDYTFEARMKTITAGSNTWEVGVLCFRYLSTNTYYFVLLHTSGKLELGESDPDGWHSNRTWVNTGFNPMQWNKFKIVVSGSDTVNIKVYLNDETQPRIDYTETQYILRNGKIALRNNSSSVCFDDIKVYPDIINFTATRLKFTSSPQTIVAGQTSGAITAQAQDNFSRIDPAFSETVSIISSSSTGRFSGNGIKWSTSNNTITSFINGSKTFYYRDTTPGNYIITIYRPGLSPDTQSITITAGIVSETTSYITLYNDRFVANGSSVCTVTVTVKNHYGVPVSGRQATIYTSRGAVDIITQPASNSDANGQCTGSLRSFYAGEDTITAVCDGITISRYSSAGAVAIWSFEENYGETGAVIFDSTENQNHGVLMSAASWTNGRLGYAIDYNGISDYVQIPANPALDSPSFSILLWFKPDQLRIQGLIDKQNFGISWRIFMDNTSGNIEWDYNDDIPEANLITSSTASIGKWSHIAATFDFDNNRTARLYFNGGMEAFSTGGSWGNTISTPLQTPSNQNNRLDGIIDELKIYGRALTDTEVRLDSKANARVNFTGTKLKFYYPPFITTKGNPSPEILIEVQGDSGGRDTTFSGTVSLSTSSNSGFFSVSKSEWVNTDVITLISGAATVYYKDNNLGSPVITVSRTGMVDTQIVSIVSQSVNETLSYLRLDTGTLPPDGIETATITITIFDTYGYPISGTKLTIVSSRGSPPDTIAQPLANSDTNGQCTGSIKSSTPGQDTITAFSGTLSNSITIRENLCPNPAFELGEGQDAYFWIEASLHSRARDRAKSSYYSLKAFSSGTGSPMASYTISFSITPNSTYRLSCWFFNSLSQGQAYLDMNDRPSPAADLHLISTNGSNAWEYKTGEWNSSSDTIANIRFVTDSDWQGAVWVDDIRLQRVPTLTFATGAGATQLVFTTPEFKLRAGDTSPQIVVVAQDSTGNTDTNFNETVSLFTSSNSGQFSVSSATWVNTSIITFNAGTGTFYYRDYYAGLPVISVYRAGLSSDTQTETITIRALKFTNLPFTITSISTGTCIVKAEDGLGNTATNFSETANVLTGSSKGSFSISGTTWLDTSIVKFSAGSAIFYYKDKKGGNPVITITRTDSWTFSDTQQETITKPVVQSSKVQLNMRSGETGTMPMKFWVSDTIEYTIYIKNTGTETATANIIIDTRAFDTSVNNPVEYIWMETSTVADTWAYTTDPTFTSWTTGSPLSGATNVKGLRWKINTLGINESRAIRFRVRVK